MGLTFVAIHPLTIVLSNAIFDIAAAPDSQLHWARLREEAQIESATHQGQWNKRTVARLTYTDAALRETVRVWGGFTGRGPVKEVVNRAGVVLPDGTHMSRGTKVGFWALTIHHDEDKYPLARQYCPERWLRQDSTPENKVWGGLPDKKSSMVSTSNNLLAFGHGRNAW